jgi:hypothetical protein
LGPFAERLAAWLRTDACRPRKQNRTARQFHTQLASFGYAGSYRRSPRLCEPGGTTGCASSRHPGHGVFVPLAFGPGEAFQFDWSEEHAVIGGERAKRQVAHLKLCHSRAFLVRAHLLQTHEILLDAHNHGFRVLGGVPRRGIYDKMRTAVDRIGPSRGSTPAS